MSIKSDTKGITIAIGGDTTGLQKSLEAVYKESDTLGRQLKSVNEALRFNPDNVTLLTEKSRLLSAAVEKAAEKVQQIKDLQEKAWERRNIDPEAYTKYVTELGRAEGSLKSLQAQLDQSENSFKSAKDSAAVFTDVFKKNNDELVKSEQAFVELNPAIKKTEHEFEALSGTIQETGNNTLTFGDILKANILSDVIIDGVHRLSAALMDIGKTVINTGIEFESSFTGVRKTVDGTAEEFAALKQGVRDMSKEIPATTKEINGVAEAAGQLGIKTNSILSFSKAMIDLGESTNLSATDAASSLAKFANITKMSQSNFDRLGSVIVALGNNFATTEKDIVNMGQRLAGTGNQVGLSEAKIMSLATALSSVGIEAEAGGSAVSKTLASMQLAVEMNSSDLKDFAKVAGMTGDAFKKAFQEDAATAFDSFVVGLGNAKDQGVSAIAMLAEMGIKEVRQRDALLRLAGASDVLTEALDVGSRAWEENIALQNEAEQRYSTMESQVQLFKNQLTDIALSVSEEVLPSIKELTGNAIQFLDENHDKIVNFSKALTGLFSFVIDNADTIASLLAGVGASFVTWNVANGIIELKTALTALGAAAGAATPPVTGLGAAVQLASGPVGIATIAIGAFVATLGLIASACSKAAEEQRAFNAACEEYQNLTVKGINSDEVEGYRKKAEQLQKLKETYEQVVEAAKLYMEQDPSMPLRSFTDSDGKDWIGAIDKAVQELNADMFELSNGFNDYGIILDFANERGKSFAETAKEISDTEEDLALMIELASFNLSQYSEELTDAERLEIEATKRKMEDWAVRQQASIEAKEAEINRLEAENAAMKVNDDTRKNNIDTIVRLKLEKNELVNSMEKNNKLITETTKLLSDEKSTTDSLNQSYADYETELAKTASEVKNLESAQEKLNKGQELSADEMNDLISLYPEIAGYIANEGDLTLQNGEIVRQVLEIKRKAALEEQQLEIDKTNVLITKSNERINQMRNELWGVQNLSLMRYMENQITKEQESLDGLIEKFAQLQVIMNSFGSGLGSSSSKSSGLGSSKSAVKEVNDELKDQLALLEHNYKMEKISTAEYINGLKEIRDAYKENSSEWMRLDEQLKKLQEEADDKDKKAKEKQLERVSDTTDAIITALKKQYDNMEEVEKRALEKSIESVKSATDEKIAEYDREYNEKLKLIDSEAYAATQAIQAEIDAIDEKTKAEEKAQKQAEFETKLSDKYDALSAAETFEEQAKIQKEIDDMLAQKERENLLAQRDEEKKVLKAQMQGVKDAAAEKARLMEEARIEAEKTLNEQLAYYDEVSKKELEIANTKNEELKKYLQDELEEYKSVYAKKMAMQGNSSSFDDAVAKLQEQLKTAATPEGKARLQKQLDELLTFKQTYFDTKELLQTKNNDVVALKEKENAYKDEQLAVSEHYKQLRESEAIEAEARKIMLEKNNSEIMELLKSFNPEWFSAGESAGKSFANGLETAETEIRERAIAIANALKDTIATELDMHSPSKVMVEKGKFAGVSFAMGLENSINAVKNASKTLAAATSILGNNAALGAAGGGTSTTNENQFSLNIDKFINNRSQDVQDLSEELGFYTKQRLRGVGQ